MRIAFFIAKRYIKKHSSTALVHYLSRLSCYSMALGTAILVLALSTMNGMEKLLSVLFYAHTPALKIESKIGKTFLHDSKLKEIVMRLSGVKDIVEVLEVTALIRLYQWQAIVTIKGVSSNFPESDFYRNCSHIDEVDFCESGTLQAAAGIRVAQLLQLAPNKNKVEVFYPRQGGYYLNKFPYKRMTLDVNGSFSIAKKPDCKYIIVPIRFVERLTDGFNKRTYWEVIVKDNLESTQASIQQVLPDGYKIINRYEQNKIRQRAIFIERLSASFIFALVLLLASLHIFFMLCMLILHKQKDIVIFTSFGATSNQIGKIIFYNGLLISLEGILYGLIIGYTLGFLQQKFGFIVFTRMGHKTPYPIEMHGFDFVFTVIVTTVFSLLASIWPIKWATQLAKKSCNYTKFHLP